jgi:hypothetical protein
MHMTSVSVFASRVAAVVTLIAVAVVIASCGSQPLDASAPYFPKDSPTPTAIAPLYGDTVASPPPARLDRPNRALTPGVAQIRNVNSVCQLPTRFHVHIPSDEQSAIFAAYGLPYPPSGHALDYLIPLALGGAAVQANIWPMSTTNGSYQDKEQLNVMLRTRVCQGAIALSTAQHEIATDWYSLWTQYGH